MQVAVSHGATNYILSPSAVAAHKMLR